MALPNRGQKALSSQHREDVPLGVSAAHVVRHAIEWDLSKSISGVSLGKLGVNEAYAAGHGRDVFGLHSGLVRAEYPIGEIPQLAATFINQFLKVRDNFPTDFRPLGWVHSSDKSWWGQNGGICSHRARGLVKVGEIVLGC